MNQITKIMDKISGALKSARTLLSLEDIHKATGISRDAVRKYVEVLVENGRVEKVEIGKRVKYYYRDPETLFGIPVSDEMKRMIEKLMVMIWEEAKKRGIEIHRTAMQKILWKLNKEFSLGILFVRYRFGQMCAYRPVIFRGEVEMFGEDGRIAKRIGELVEEAKGKTREEMAKKQYDEEGMEEFKFIMGIREGLRNRKMEEVALNSLKLSRHLIYEGMGREADLVMDIPYYLELVMERGSLEEVKELFEKVVKFIGIGFVEKDLARRYGFDEKYAELLVERKRRDVLEEIRELVAEIEAKYPPRVSRETEEMFEDIRKTVRKFIGDRRKSHN